MLTDTQKIKINQLIEKCTHEPLKNILTKATDQWSKDTSPIRNIFGVNLDKDNKYISCDGNSCLVTSAMIGEKSSFNFKEFAKEEIPSCLKNDFCDRFGVSYSVLGRIINLFDGEQFTAKVDSIDPIIEELYDILFVEA
jgi:hypothetical protein